MTFQITLAADGRAAPAIVAAALECQRLVVSSSFSLRSALSAGGDCGCLEHGTPACQCQYAVLLVYDPDQPAGGPPVTVTVHSRAAAAWVTVVQEVTAPPAPALVDQVLAALASLERSARRVGPRPAG